MRRLLALLVVLALAVVARADEPPQGYQRVVSDDVVVERVAVDEALAQRAVAAFRDMRAVVEKRLGKGLGAPAPLLILAPTDAEFAKRYGELAAGPPPTWALAVAIPGRHCIIVRGPGLATGNDFLAPTLAHEISHLVLGEIGKGCGGIPRWLDEGLAQLAENRSLTREEFLDVANAAHAGSLPTFDELEGSFPSHADQANRAYFMSLSFVEWLDAKARPDGIRSVVGELANGYTVEGAVRRTTGMSLHAAMGAWRAQVAGQGSVFEALFRSGPFWWGMLSVLVVLAFLVQVVRSRRMRAKLPD